MIEKENLIEDEFHNNHYKHIMNAISDERSTRYKLIPYMQLETHLAKLYTYENEAYRNNKLNIKHRDESQKLRRILFINTFKKVAELQNQEHKASKIMSNHFLRHEGYIYSVNYPQNIARNRT